MPSPPSKPLRIFFSAGEPSGDLHGANLIRQLREMDPRVEAVGYGGPQMEAAGCKLDEDLTALAVMWIVRVILNLHKFWGLVSRADRLFRRHRPDAVVLIDFPGFNWWIARRAKAHGIPVFYYCPPQIWAWARWRVKKMRRLVDHALCGLPFEAEWLVERGVPATFVGHPFFDEVRRQELDAEFLVDQQGRPGPLVTILPGSRNQEVEGNLADLLKAAAQVRAAVPETRLAVAAFKPSHAEMARQQAAAAGLPIEVHVDRTPELIRAARCTMAVSGSVSLELLAATRPTVILYRMSKLAFSVQLRFVKVRYITLVNLLAADDPFTEKAQPYDPAAPGAERVLFPEYPTWEDKSAQLASHVVQWLTDEAAYERRVAELAELKAEVAHGGASRKAAEHILGALRARQAPVPRPHFVLGEHATEAADLGPTQAQ